MLEGLDSIPWQNLRHAYGPATDVPGLLHEITSDDAKHREKAWNALYGNLWHQGTVYEATAHAVPFLIALTEERQVPERHCILNYLGTLAHGNSYLDVHQHLSIYEEERHTPDFQKELERELADVSAAREAVRAGAPVYGDLLEDREPLVRAGAAHLLGQFGEDASRNGAWIIRHVEAGERDLMACTACVFSVSLLASHQGDHTAWLETMLRGKDREPVRVAAALGLACAFRTATSEAARAVIIATARQPGGVGDIFSRFPWFDSDVQAYCSWALQVMGGEVEDSLPGFIAALNDVAPYQSWEVARAMLNLVFAGQAMPPGTTVDRLTGDQRTALAAIAASKTFWTGSGRNRIVVNAVQVLEDFGLPDRQDTLRAFLEGR